MALLTSLSHINLLFSQACQTVPYISGPSNNLCASQNPLDQGYTYEIRYNGIFEGSGQFRVSVDGGIINEATVGYDGAGSTLSTPDCYYGLPCNYAEFAPSDVGPTFARSTIKITWTGQAVGRITVTMVKAGVFGACGNKTHTRDVHVVQPPSTTSIQLGSGSSFTTNCNPNTNYNYFINAIPNGSYTWSVPSGWSIVSGTNSNSVVVKSNANNPGGQLRITTSTGCGYTNDIKTANLTIDPNVLYKPSTITAPTGELCGSGGADVSTPASITVSRPKKSLQFD
ncbi:MAG: hypothetical protein EAZ07_10485 [Cytophagales bacterium]|nr:MAG: hypothetical protein EAZ07_10485 [Cytophagales bacterium]